MGGIIVLLAVILPTFLWAKLSDKHILLILLATIWMGAIGFLDDYLKVVKRYPKGLIAKYKMAGQISLGLVIGSLRGHWSGRILLRLWNGQVGE